MNKVDSKVKVNAYILAADPAWIEASVLSYYDHVDRIIVSYDENQRGWTGVPIDVDQCLRRLRAIDTAKKVVELPGHFARLDVKPMENETFQRQMALNKAGEGAEWVLQLDTDEVMMAAEVFRNCLTEATEQKYSAIDFPARWIYRRLGPDRYLEACTRMWRIAAGYPGPMAVRSGTQLTHARQTSAPLFRVDFRWKNTDPWHERSAPVHRVIRETEAILHLSMARTADQWKNKVATFGHARDADWGAEYRRWLWCGRHPYLASITTPFQRKAHKRMIRVVRIPEPPVLSKSAEYG